MFAAACSGSQESKHHICQDLHTLMLLVPCPMMWQGKQQCHCPLGKGRCFPSDMWMFLGTRAKGCWGCWCCCSSDQLAGLCSCQSAQPCSRCPSQFVIRLDINPHHQAQRRHPQAGGITEVSCQSALLAPSLPSVESKCAGRVLLWHGLCLAV